MRNGPVLWAEILRIVRDIGGINPIIAGGAVRDYVLKLGDPKDIDVFIGGQPPDDMLLPGDWAGMIPDAQAIGQEPVQPEYNGQIGTITAIQNWATALCNCLVQFIWIGDNDPVQYVRGFDLGTSKCYYRGSLVLGKDFLNDWHHQEITILESAFQEGRDVERSRARALRLQQRYRNGAAIRENVPLDVPVVGRQVQEFWNGADWPNILGNQLAVAQNAPVGDMWAEIPGQGAAQVENAPAQQGREWFVR